MTLNEFCRVAGVDFSSVAAEVDAGVGLLADDVLLVVGSLVEGLGNSKSDLDLLLITPRAAELLPRRDEIAIIVGRCVVDVRILRLADIELLLARLDEWARLPWDVMHAAKFTKEERVLLHRLLHGQLVPHKVQGNAVARPARNSIARLNLHVARHISRTIQVDMVGYRESGDYRSLVFAAQELLGHAVDALLSGHGLTNPLPKWRSRLLDSIPADWESALTIRPSGITAGQRVWQLHRAPEDAEEESSLEYALRITAFARAVFAWAERRLVRALPESEEQTAWPRVERSPADTVLPYLDFDVDFLLADEAVTVGRLNDFGETLRLSAREFALALFCDGTTTAREAEAFVFGCSAGKAGTNVADGLIARIMVANLSFKHALAVSVVRQVEVANLSR